MDAPEKGVLGGNEEAIGEGHESLGPVGEPERGAPVGRPASATAVTTPLRRSRRPPGRATGQSTTVIRPPLPRPASSNIRLFLNAPAVAFRRTPLAARAAAAGRGWAPEIDTPTMPDVVRWHSARRGAEAQVAATRADLRVRPARPRAWPRAWLRSAAPCVLVILAVQVLFALRLIWSNTAQIDEATYLYAGSQEIAHWLHGIHVANFQLFFSGAPVVYPPVGAVVNAIGGLTGARLLSLAFVLGTTCLGYGVAARLFGRRAAVLGMALFASLGVTQFLSVFATYDPMALFLLALSVFLVVWFGTRPASMPAMVYSTALAPCVLALANAAKYASALWDPLVVLLALCVPVLGGQTWRLAAIRAARFLVVLLAALGMLLLAGKHKYLTGIWYTTFSRPADRLPGMGIAASRVFRETLQLGALPLAATLLGVLALICFRERRELVITGVLLLACAVAAPINHIRIGTTVALDKHMVFGAWFGCMLGGYALARLTSYRVPAMATAAVLTGLLPLYFAGQAYALFHQWRPVSPAFVAGLRGVVTPGHQKYLITGSMYVPAYYLGPSVTSTQWKESVGYTLARAGGDASYTGVAALDHAIRGRIFAAVIVVPDGTANEPAVENDLFRYGGYYLAGYLPPPASGLPWRCQVWLRDGLSLPRRGTGRP